jgi:glycosyltransferase involved in cell wall biosynthesis
MTPKNSRPKVSVCIPTYNYAWCLGAAIESVIAQSFQDWELVICDDSSTDNTEAVIALYQALLGARLRFYRNERRLGLPGNFNRVTELAEGEYIKPLCADDVLHPHALEQLVQALDQHPSAAIAACDREEFIDEAGHNGGPGRARPFGPGLVSGREVLRTECRFHGTIGVPSHVMLRASYLGSGPVWNPALEHCMDLALWCSLCEQWDVVYAEGALIYIRGHPGQATRTNRATLVDIRDHSELFQKLFHESPTLGGHRRYRYQFVRYHLYPWFERAMEAALRGEWKKSLWILGRIASFCWVPWWFPYFTLLMVQGSLLRTGRRLRNRLGRVPSFVLRPLSFVLGGSYLLRNDPGPGTRDQGPGK